MEAIEKKIRINSIIRGILLGAATMVASIGAYYMITGLRPTAAIFIFLPTIISVLLPILVVILLLFNLRKSIGGYWTFRQATSGIFVMFLTGFLLHAIFYDLIFAKIIEPNMLQKTEISAIAAKRFLMSQQHQPQAKIAQSIADTKKEFEQQKQITAGRIIQGIFFYIIFIFLLALIFASMFKKDPPLYTNAAQIN